MQLNIDLIRDILLKAELNPFEILVSNDYFFDESDENYQKPKEFSCYSDEEIEYHVKYLEKTDFLKTKLSCGRKIKVTDLTTKSHIFVSNIKNIENWNKIKEISDNIGSSSIETLIKISEKLISKLIENHFIQFQ